MMKNTMNDEAMKARNMAFEAIMENAQKTKTGRMNAVIQVNLITADDMYQRVEGRNRKKYMTLKHEWDYNLMDALMVVPHYEECMFYVVDGLGRLTVAKELGIDKLDCVIIVGPDNPQERRMFEASIFLRQAIGTDPLRPAQMHKARIINGDPIATTIERVCSEYEIGILPTDTKDKRLGSYDRTYRLVGKYGGEKCLRWVLDVIKFAGYREERRPYSGRLMTVLAKFYDGYNDISAKAVGDFLRGKSPMIFQADAVSAYPKRAHNPEIPMILYLQDWAMNNYDKEIVFDLNGKKMKLVAA